MIDIDEELDHEIYSLDMSSQGEHKTVNSTHEKVVRNKSELSTTQLVQRLKEDHMFMKAVNHFLLYETELYQFALQLHVKQVSVLGGKYSL